MYLSKLRKFRLHTLVLFSCCLIFSQCDEGKPTNEKAVAVAEKPLIVPPVFNADSAFKFIEDQVAFGPRIPNTRAHALTKEYIATRLSDAGGEVTEQEFTARTFDNVSLNLTNIFASFNPKAKKRILLAAHWDTRPVADQDDERKDEPIDGANDGGSGVGVLLEIARTISGDSSLKVGVDMIFFDGEDYGAWEGKHAVNQLPYGGYCLGSDYWAQNKHKAGYTAYYGILLDMVGAKNARFFQESTSLNYGQSIVKKVWNIAQRSGSGSYFINTKVQGIIDDHVPVSEKGGIPMIDIVDHRPESKKFFNPTWHTHDDRVENISKASLKAVGRTVLYVLYNEE